MMVCMRGLGSFLKDAYRLSKPYFTRSDEKLSAWGLLIAIIVLNLAQVALSVVLNYLAPRVLQLVAAEELARLPGPDLHVPLARPAG